MTLWDTRAARIAFTVAMVAILFYAVYAMRRTLFIFVLAVFFAYMVYPLVRAVDRYRPVRAPPIMSPIVALVLLLAVLVMGGALIGPSLMEQATRLTDQLPALFAQSGTSDTWPWPTFLKPYGERIATFARSQLQSSAAAALPLAQRVGTGVLAVAGNLLFIVLIPIMAFLLIVNGPRIRQGLWSFASRSREGHWERMIDDLDRLLGGYIRALFLLSLATFTAYALFLSLTGAPYALLLAAMAAILEFIPVFGPLIAVLVVLIVAGLSGYAHLLWIVFFIAGYRVFQDYVLAPKLMAEGAGVHPILVIFGLLAGEELAGIPGIFVSVPLIAIAIIMGRHLIHSRRVDPPLSREP